VRACKTNWRDADKKEPEMLSVFLAIFLEFCFTPSPTPFLSPPNPLLLTPSAVREGVYLCEKKIERKSQIIELRVKYSLYNYRTLE